MWLFTFSFWREIFYWELTVRNLLLKSFMIFTKISWSMIVLFFIYTGIAKHFRCGSQEDAHEFLRYTVDAMQKSCLPGTKYVSFQAPP